jgi:hypothetical protein
MKPIWTIVISFVATAGIVGGGTYYLVNSKATKDKNNLQTQITDLNKKMADTEKSLADAQSTTMPTATTTTSSATDETESWKTYSNTAYGFSLKYPSSCTANVASSYASNDGVYIDDASTGGYEQPHLLIVEAEQSSLTLDAYQAKASKDATFTQAAAITFAGQPAYEGVSNGMTSSYGIIVKKGSYIYHLDLSSGNKDTLAQNKAGLSAIQNKILSTFQFTK